MEDLSKFCFHCMELKGDHRVCPHCGKADTPKQLYPLLPLGSYVGGRYYIGKAIRQNGEGVTYAAYDNKEFHRCTIREFFPQALSARDPDMVSVFPASGSLQAFSECRDSFNDMWKKLMRLRGLTALITVTDVFAAGNTSYAVYAESEEITLRDRLLSIPQGYLDWEQARILFMPVLSTLGTLHTSGVIHKGINPEAFIFTEDGRLKLTDFCIPQVRTAYGDLDSDIHDGYAPLEVYSEDGNLGTWTDIYSFTGVLYRALVGTTPISAPVRAQNDQMMIPAPIAEKLPPYVINALINGMQIEPKDRTRNVEQLRSNLSASPRAVSASASVYKADGRFSLPGGELRTAPVTVAPGGVQPTYPAQRPANPGVVIVPGQSVSGLVDPVTSVPGVPAKRPLQDAAQDAYMEQQKKDKQRKTLTLILVPIIVLFIVGAGLIVSSLFGSGGPGSHETTEAPSQQSQTMTVPSFVGKYFDDIAHDAYYSQFLHIIKAENSSTEFEAGVIMYQSVPQGTTVAQGTEIILTVSSGKKTFLVPDVTGMTYEQALSVLAPQGLVCAKASKYNDGTHVPDTVAETFPLAGQSITQGDTIQVILWSDGSQEDTTAEDESTAEIQTDESGRQVIGPGSRN